MEQKTMRDVLMAALSELQQQCGAIRAFLPKNKVGLVDNMIDGLNIDAIADRYASKAQPAQLTPEMIDAFVGNDGGRKPEQVNQQMLSALKSLYRGYVSTLETGRDRIVALGGQCDAVDVMERNDPALRDARSAIAAAEAAQQVTQQADPVALSLPFFAYDEEVGLERFFTEAEAKKFVQDGIDEYRSNMLQGEAWPSDIENLCWGVVLGSTKEIKLGDVGDGSGDYYSDYVLAYDAHPPAVAVPAIRELTDDELWAIRNHVAINEVTRDDDSRTICVKQGRAVIRAMLAAAQKSEGGE